MAKQIQTKFLKGINRRFDRADSSSAEGFFSLQNARVNERGEMGEVSRIKGYTNFEATNNYSDLLDIASNDQFYIVYYRTSSGNFTIDIYNNSGTEQDSFSFTADDATEGKITVLDQSFYLAPHNKILHYNNGNWQLEDYISKTPTIDEVTAEGTKTKAQFTVSIDGDAGAAAIPATSAVGTISILGNNTPLNKTSTIQVTVGGSTTAEVSVSYTDTVQDITKNVLDALKAVTAITNDWNVTQFSRNVIQLTSKSKGSSWNDTSFSITTEGSEIVGEGDGDGEEGDGPISIDFPDSFSLITREPRNPGGSGRGGSDGSGRSGGFGFDPITVGKIGFSGGRDASGDVGKLLVVFDEIDRRIEVPSIKSLTASQIAAEIVTAFEAKNSLDKHYTISRSSATLTITAKEGGKEFNTTVSMYMPDLQQTPDDIFSGFTYTQVTEGTETDADSALGAFEDYWYTCRYRYLDGHVTQTTYPVHVNTGPQQNIEVDITNTDTDIDGTRPQVEIFRRKGSDNFFLVERTRPTTTSFTFTDTGEPNREPLNDKFNIWTKSHETQEIVDNYYVRGNIDYFDEEFTWDSNNDFSITTPSTSEDDQLPRNSKVTVYIKPEYEDGTRGYHKKIGQVDVNSYNQKLTIAQNAEVTNSDKTVKNVGVYGRFDPHGEEFRFRFNSFELANPNIPTIEDPSFYPSRTQVFFGFKYLEVFISDEGSAIGARIGKWNISDSNYPIVYLERDIVDNKYGFSSSGTFDEKYPQSFTLSGENNKFPLTYNRIAHYDATLSFPNQSDQTGTRLIYKLSMFDALQQAVATGDLTVRLTSEGENEAGIPDNPDISFGRTRDRDGRRTGDRDQFQDPVLNDPDLQELEIGVKSLIDRSKSFPELKIREVSEGEATANTIYSPQDSRIYLQLEESILDDVSDNNINNYSIKTKYSKSESSIFSASNITSAERALSLAYRTGSLNFEFVNFDLDTAGTQKGSSISINTPLGTYTRFDWNWDVFDLVNKNTLRDVDSLIYLGSKDNTTTNFTPDITGFFNPPDDNLNYTFLNPFNILETPIEESDFNLDRQSFPNQLVWSDPLTEGSLFTGGRNIRAESFFAIGEDKGSLVDIVALFGRLYAFCSRGVARINVGEIVTQQSNGQMFVDSSRVLTDYQWIFDGLRGTQRNTIVRHNNTIFFSDGYDVYNVAEGVQNISQGRLDLDPDNTYSAYVNNKHNEYVLCDLTSGESWAYGLETGVWYGPYTFTVSKGAFIKNQTVGETGGDLVELDNGNTFAGSSFTTLLQNAIDDSELSFYDKTWRKFYIQADNHTNAVFKYGKDDSSLTSVNFSAMTEKNGYLHQGVTPSEGNTKSMYWDISTTDDGFTLRELTPMFTPRRRR